MSTRAKKVFIDGKAGTTGLRIYERLEKRSDILLQTLSDTERKDPARRKEALNSCEGGKAIGLCGIDGHMIQAEKQDERLGYVGEITKVNVAPILDVLEKGYIPVVSTVGCDSEGNTYNINADTAAARIAGELKAESFISMTDIAGILRNKDDDSTLISEIPVSDAPKLMREGIISGGMIPKVNCCIEAIRRGVRKVFIIDGRIPHAILIETLTDEGIGTMFITGNTYEHSKN